MADYGLVTDSMTVLGDELASVGFPAPRDVIESNGEVGRAIRTGNIMVARKYLQTLVRAFRVKQKEVQGKKDAKAQKMLAALGQALKFCGECSDNLKAAAADGDVYEPGR